MIEFINILIQQTLQSSMNLGEFNHLGYPSKRFRRIEQGFTFFVFFHCFKFFFDTGQNVLICANGH